MRSPTTSRFSLAAVLTLVVTTTSQAGFITVTNAGFESPSLANGNFTNTGLISGWVVSPVSPGVGTFNPTSNHYSSEAPEGFNIAYLNGTRSISQTVGATLTANAAYELSVLVGFRKDTAIATFAGYGVELLAGSTVIASEVNVQTIARDQFKLITVTYTTSTSDAHIGQALTIRLRTTGGTQTNFDDVKLSQEGGEVTAVPAPPGVVLAAVGVACVGVARFRRRPPAVA